MIEESNRVFPIDVPKAMATGEVEGEEIVLNVCFVEAFSPQFGSILHERIVYLVASSAATSQYVSFWNSFICLFVRRMRAWVGFSSYIIIIWIYLRIFFCHVLDARS